MKKVSTFLAVCLLIIAISGTMSVSAVWADSTSSNLLVYPYLGNTTPNSVVVSWATDSVGAGEVHYSLDQSYNNIVAAASNVYDGRTWYSAALTGLSTNTNYYYRVFDDGSDITPWSMITFTTAAESTGTDFTFTVVGDNQPPYAGAPPYQAALDIAAVMKQQTPNLVLHSGDMINDGSICSGSSSAWSQYVSNFFGVYRTMLGNTPFFTAIGNHEVETGGCGYQAYKSVFALPANAPAGHSEEYYSFDWGNAHFVLLDTDQDFSTGGAQYNWLVNDLRTTSQLWKIAVFHVPPYSSGDIGSNAQVQAYLVPLFETYGVNVVFNGHDHDYERTCPIRNGACTTTQNGGVVYFVNGGGGAYTSLVGTSWFTAYSAHPNEFLRVHVSDCQLQLDAVNRYGTVFDSYVIDRCGIPPAPTPTATATSTTTPIPMPTAMPSGFPGTGVLDTFDRGDGAVGPNWSADKSGYKITGNQLGVTTGGILYWNASLLGPDQEAYVTFANIDSAATNMDLLLKSQSTSVTKVGLVEVWYSPASKLIRIYTYTTAQGWVKRGANLSATFSIGDQLGARANANGLVYVYRNGTLLGTWDITAWPYYASGGYIGVLTANAPNALFDNFGGGTIQVSATSTPSPTATNTPTPTNTLTDTPTPTPTATATNTPTPTITPTPTPLPLVAFWDDFDPVKETWTHSAGQGIDDWSLSTARSHSSTTSYFSSEPATVKDDYLRTRAITIPANGQLTFWHTYKMESGRDGSVIEISTNGGVTFADLGSYITSSGYSGSISTKYGSPIGGRAAWTGNRLGIWSQVVVDLRAYAGQNIILRFRMTSDNARSGSGWNIDDVRVSGTSQ